MRTWQLNGYSIKELNIEDRPVPKINNKNDVLIKMQSASLNFRDLIMINVDDKLINKKFKKIKSKPQKNCKKRSIFFYYC